MLAGYVAQRTGKPAGEIDRERRFDRLGLDSADAVALVGELEDFVDRPLSAYLPYEHPMIHQLARAWPTATADVIWMRCAGRAGLLRTRRSTRCPLGRSFSVFLVGRRAARWA